MHVLEGGHTSAIDALQSYTETADKPIPQPATGKEIAYLH